MLQNSMIRNGFQSSSPIIPMFRRVLLRKPSHAGIIVPRTEIVRPALYIEIFSAVTEGVGVGADAVFFVAEGVVGLPGRRCRPGFNPCSGTFLFRPACPDHLHSNHKDQILNPHGFPKESLSPLSPKESEESPR